jgi:NTP pyrophosphatase (non-canonical NTP hydrolase)
MQHLPEFLAAIRAERLRQETLREGGKFPWTCADPTVVPHAKLAVLAEEFGEVSRHVTEYLIDQSRLNQDELYQELVEVAACCAAWCEAISIGRGNYRQ